MKRRSGHGFFPLHAHQPTEAQARELHDHAEAQVAAGNFFQCVSPGCDNLFVRNPEMAYPERITCPACGVEQDSK